MKKSSLIALFICLSGLIINPATALPGKTGGALPDNATEQLNQPSTTNTQSSEPKPEGETTK